MTRYLLNSGNLSSDPAKKAQFFKELLTIDGASSPKLLVCMFAQAREHWHTRYSQFKDLSEIVGFPIEVELAMPDTFDEQCKQSDAVYIFGGDDTLLHYWLSKFDLKHLFDGKNIGGNSSGSSNLCVSYWASDWRKCMDGFGLVPAKYMYHYKSWDPVDDPRGPIDWARAKEDLAAYGDTSLPIHALPDADWVTIEVE